MPKEILFTDEQIAKMVDLYENTEASTRTLGKMFGCGQNTINKALKSNGVAVGSSKKLSQQRIGKPNKSKGKPRNLSNSTRLALKIRATGNTWCVGRKLSSETIAKISAGTKGKNVKWSPEEKKLREDIRQASKRFIRRILSSTGKKKEIPSEKYLGYSKDQLIAHLGPKPEGEQHIDHRVPIAEFLNRGIHDAAIINALPNLGWLDGHTNRCKNAKLPPETEELIAQCIEIRHDALMNYYSPGM